MLPSSCVFHFFLLSHVRQVHRYKTLPSPLDCIIGKLESPARAVRGGRGAGTGWDGRGRGGTGRGKPPSTGRPPRPQRSQKAGVLTIPCLVTAQTPRSNPDHAVLSQEHWVGGTRRSQTSGRGAGVHQDGESQKTAEHAWSLTFKVKLGDVF